MSVRQLIANGKQKVALEKAKEIHKAQHSAASEALLVDAYAARISSLMQQNLTVEAKSLLELARERYPSHRERLDQLTAPAMARAGNLAELVQPLSDPATTSERRMAIEQALQQELWDLGALAECGALPPDDPLRKAASALHRAFLAVTNGPVDEESLALPEVSRRSPLAPWKMLLRAISSFYRREDETCRKCLDAIQPDSAPARLVPAIHAMLGDKTGAHLTAASAALLSRTKESAGALRTALDALDRAFASDDKSHMLQAIRAAMQECRRNAPGLADRLMQHIEVRSAMAGLSPDKMTAAAGRRARQEASLLRLMARGLEETKDEEKLAVAAGMWNEFRIQAVREGWFAENGVEAAAIYLHIAGLLTKLPREMKQQLDRSARRDGVDAIFVQPNTLYQRACAIDPHSEAFSQWMDWAKGETGGKAKRIAEAWHKAVPLDMAPILYLMKTAEKRGSFPAALKYLAKAERIDSVHSDVRKARLRLMAGNAIRQIQQKKYDAALKEVAAMDELPQSQQAGRPAFLAALRYTVNVARGNTEQAAAHRAAIDWQLEDRAAGGMLASSVAAACKAAPENLGPVDRLKPAERASLPAAMARVAELAEDMRITLSLPKAWLYETQKQLWQDRDALDTARLRTLAEAALRAKFTDLAYAATAAGLERGVATEARFLFLRAQSLPAWQSDRSEVCAAAAATLARQKRDTELIEEAVELLHGPLDADDLTVTLDQAAEVLRKEKAEQTVPGNGPGPDYSDILGEYYEDGVMEDICQCPNCRRRRGEMGESDFEPDDSYDEEFLRGMPEDMPPELGRMFLEETKRAVMNGESIEQVLSRLTGQLMPGGRKKGRRK